MPRIRCFLCLNSQPLNFTSDSSCCCRKKKKSSVGLDSFWLTVSCLKHASKSFCFLSQSFSDISFTGHWWLKVQVYSRSMGLNTSGLTFNPWGMRTDGQMFLPVDPCVNNYKRHLTPSSEVPGWLEPQFPTVVISMLHPCIGSSPFHFSWSFTSAPLDHLCMIRPLKMAVLLLSAHPLLNHSLLHLYPTHMTELPS